MNAAARKDWLHRRCAALEERIAAACRRAGRARQEVTLVAVTKKVAPEIVALLPELGYCHLGESRPQELWRKAAVVPGAVHWHLIGSLQRNKIEKTLPLVHLIHSVDSWRLLQALDEEAHRQQRELEVLLEVNASREPNKHGFAPAEVPELLPRLESLQCIRVRGLMTMAAFDDEPEHCRPTFAALRQLRDRLSASLSGRHALEHLSMGMSNDFEVAVEEGATLIRVGSALFEGMPEEDA